MDRRCFIKQIILYSAGYSLTIPRFTIAKTDAALQQQSEIAVVTGSNYQNAVRETVNMLGTMQKFVRPGDKVVIKPSIGWDRRPEMAATTHPMVVKALAELALEADAKEILIFDRTCNEPRRCYINSGMAEAIETLNSRAVKLQHIDKRKFVPVEIAKGKSLTSWDIYKDILTADCYINVPVAKHHGLSRLTLGLKNSMGVIGGNRGRLHHDLGQKLADLATVTRPALTVIDATRILLANGPQGGSLADVKKLDTVIASTDPVAADAFATTLFGLQPRDISSTLAAYRLGLGQMDLSKVRLMERVL